MVSRKKNQGKARKAAKAREEAEERRNNQTTNANGQQRQAPEAEAQMHRPTISQNGDGKCRHGFEKMNKICAQFVLAFGEAYNNVVGVGGRTIADCLLWAKNATKDEFAEVWNDSAKMKIAMSFYLFGGAQNILKGENGITTRGYAIFARYFEQHTAVELHQTQATMNWPKIEELMIHADEHTLVKFLRGRIPCSCLDKIYEDVKSVTKMGLCYNPQCSLPDRITERSKTMYCSRCRFAIYCSRECQKAHWATHKSCCDMAVAWKAEFDAKKQQDDTP